VNQHLDGPTCGCHRCSPKMAAAQESLDNRLKDVARDRMQFSICVHHILVVELGHNVKLFSAMIKRSRPAGR
jgi:hypothetical protein